MDCTQVKEYLAEYVDGFLPDELKKQVEAHLADCASCKKEADALQCLRGEIRALKLTDTDDFVFDMARAKQPESLSLMRRTWVRNLSAVAACCVLFIGIYATVQNGYQAPETQEPALQVADTASDVASDAMPASEEVQFKTRAIDVPLAEDYSDYAVDGVVPFSAVPEAALGEMPIVVHDVAQPSAAPDNNMAASGSSGANAVKYTKRTVTLMVIDVAKESFECALPDMLLSGFDGETVIAETDLQLLLGIDGVTVVTDTQCMAETDKYAGKVIINY